MPAVVLAHPDRIQGARNQPERREISVANWCLGLIWPATGGRPLKTRQAAQTFRGVCFMMGR